MPSAKSPSWMPIALSYLGEHEVAGKDTNPIIAKFFAEAGHKEVTDDETPWCSAFVNAIMFEAGLKGTQNLAARSWLDWGREIDEPEYGCVCVMKRGDSSWQGHVFFFVREEGDYIVGLGGNQGDSVSVAKFPKSKMLGYRMPKTLGSSRTVKATLVSGGGETGGQILDAIQKTTETASSLPLNIAKYACFVLAILGLAAVVYFKRDEIKAKWGHLKELTA